MSPRLFNSSALKLLILGTMKNLLLIFFLLSGIRLYAQNNPARVYLKNGSVINGYLQEESHKVKIKTSTGNVWVFDKSEIDSIKSVKRLDRSMESVSKGYMSFTSFGFLAGLPKSVQEMIFSLESSHGYSWNFGLYTGLAAGLELYQSALLPLSMDIRYFLKRQGFRPFVRAKAGFSFPIEDPEDRWNYHYDAMGGQSYGLGGGIYLPVSGNNAIIFESLYRLQDARVMTINEWNNDKVKITERFRRLEFRMGFVF